MDTWPVTGRADEMRQLHTAVLEGRGAVITGSAGVGKTTVAVACLEAARQAGLIVAHTTATHASRELPFGAFASFLLPDTHHEVAYREGSGDLLRRYVRQLVEQAGGRPMVMFVDDAHLLDNGSATLLHQLALQQAATVLATVRAGEVGPDPVVALWKDGPAERVALDVLDGNAIDELLTEVLGGPVADATARHLTVRCGGNPLFLRELVTGALETETLAIEGGVWRLQGNLRPTARLVELVAFRIGALSPDEQELVELLTMGEPLGVVELSRLVDPAHLDGLEKKRIVSSISSDSRLQVRLAHPLFGEVLRQGISAFRRREIARSLAAVMESVGTRRREDSLRLASLQFVGGGGSAELLEEGATAARARHDFSLAEQLARAAIDRGAGFEARFVAAEAAHAQGRIEQADLELAELAADASSDAERSRVALVRFERAFFRQGRAEFGFIDEVDAVITDQRWKDELQARRLFVIGFGSGPTDIVEAGLAMLRSPGFGSETTAHVTVSYGLARLGRIEEATRLFAHPVDSGSLPSAEAP